jgi:di/tricarboxylate transporter
MAADTLFVFVLIAVAAALMASNKLRFDIIALLVVIALMLSGVLTVSEALAGFGSSVVMLVAGLLVVGEMLDRTGVHARGGTGGRTWPLRVYRFC